MLGLLRMIQNEGVINKKIIKALTQLFTSVEEVGSKIEKMFVIILTVFELEQGKSFWIRLVKVSG